MPDVALKRLSFDELDAIEDRDGLRYELWNGEPVAMTGGTRAHNVISLGLYRAIHSQLPTGCESYVADVSLRLNPSAYSDKAYPDVMVVCEPQDGVYQTKPILVAEVLSESSVSRDRNRKFKAYTALDSLEVYLILSQTAVEVEVYRRANRWAEEIYRASDAVIELSAPPLQIPLHEIYQDVWVELTGGHHAEQP